MRIEQKFRGPRVEASRAVDCWRPNAIGSARPGQRLVQRQVEAASQTRKLAATYERLVVPTSSTRAQSTSSSASAADSDLTAFLKETVESLNERLEASWREAIQAAVNLERVRGEMELLRERGKHDMKKLEIAKNQTIKDIETAKDRRIGELEERQARDGIDFLLKNRTVSARGAVEWAEREVRRLRFPGEKIERRQIWSYTVKTNDGLRECFDELGWSKAEAASKMVELYGKISTHIHDKFSSEMTASRPIIILREGTGDGFLTAAEAGAVKCICRLFRLSYDAYQRDLKTGDISTSPETFRAMPDENITKATRDFYAQMEADLLATKEKNEADPSAAKGQRQGPYAENAF